MQLDTIQNSNSDRDFKLIQLAAVAGCFTLRYSLLLNLKLQVSSFLVILKAHQTLGSKIRAPTLPTVRLFVGELSRAKNTHFTQKKILKVLVVYREKTSRTVPYRTSSISSFSADFFHDHSRLVLVQLV
jgi:hypothetical protein